MTVDPPRRLRPRAAQRNKTITTQTKGAPSAKGSTAAARPVSTLHRARILTPTASSASRDRITIQWFTNDINSDQGLITSWGGYGAAFDYSGSSIQLSDPVSDNGRIYLFGEGIYSVQIAVQANVSLEPSADLSIRAVVAVWDAPDSEAFGCGLRGGDASGYDSDNVASSRTFYSQGRGISGGGLEFHTKCRNGEDFTNRVWVTAIVQKIVGFGF